MQPKLIFIQLFGGLRAQREGQEPIEFAPQQASALLAYLALQLPHNRPREEIIEQLWPKDEVDTRGKLRHYLSDLRSQFEQPPFERNDLLPTNSPTVGLKPNLVCTDVSAFEEALRAATQTTDPTERAQHLSEAVGQYRGDLLPGFYQDYFVAEKNRLSGLYGEAHLAYRAFSRAAAKTGNNIAVRIEIIEITNRNSIMVKPETFLPE